MLWRSMPAEARVRLITRAILLVGFVSAVVIYFANAGPGSASDYELERSKLYLHDMEVFGGKANILADEFRNWFDGLWHGRSLAFTVAVISVFTALAYRFVATPLPLPAAVDGEAGREENGPRSGA
jgi:hypothetical protein